MILRSPAWRAVPAVPAAAQTAILTLPTTINTGGSNNFFQHGWEFRVGAASIIVSKLRTYSRDAVAQPNRTLRLWRVSDQALLASVNLSITNDTWHEASITPVTLLAGQNYIVTERAVDGSATPRAPAFSNDLTGASFNSAITFVQSRTVDGTGFPTSVSANRLFGITDVTFT